MPLSPGTRLGSYEGLSSLGEGGMGEVYRAATPDYSATLRSKSCPSGGLAGRQVTTVLRFTRQRRHRPRPAQASLAQKAEANPLTVLG